MNIYIAALCLKILDIAFGHGIADGSKLHCHCLENATCDASGYCANGCERGWYGPGCQIGNVALRRPAAQSSTFTGDQFDNSADRAVDGAIPSNYSSVYCSHTVPNDPSYAWWYVTLDGQQEFVIQNITIVNRVDHPIAFPERLSNFSIIYTTSIDISPMLIDDWHVCHTVREYKKDQYFTYSCSGDAVAKRVGIRLRNDQMKNILTLCEVIVNGYQKHNCSQGYTGPGCLLRDCNNSLCNGECSNANGCYYLTCRNSSVLSPNCWIKFPSLKDLHIATTPTCNNLTVSGHSQVHVKDLVGLELRLQVKVGKNESSYPIKTLATEVVNISLTVPASAGEEYSVRVVAQWCSTNGTSCLIGSASNWSSVTKLLKPDHCALPCHCANSSLCNANGICPAGCDYGWYEPDCQSQFPSLEDFHMATTATCNNITVSGHSQIHVKDLASLELQLQVKVEQNEFLYPIKTSANDRVNFSLTVPASAGEEYTVRVVAQWCRANGTLCQIGSASKWYSLTNFLKPGYCPLPCHCANSSRCNANGFCPGGCDRGWYGPGCQVGNFAFQKKAFQSSTYNEDKLRKNSHELVNNSAGMAVDGEDHRNNPDHAQYCTHTQTTSGDYSWWYVELDSQRDVVIRRVTIYNRWNFRDRLSNFSIVYTSVLKSQQPDSKWSTCFYNSGNQANRIQTYGCYSNATGAKLGVILRNNATRNILTLCEVEVDGYLKNHCAEGFTGPGCLLHDCRSNCISGCDDFGGCKHSSCPDSSFLPPDCWIRLPSHSRTVLNASATCNRIGFTTESIFIDGDLNATKTTIIIKTSSETFNESIQLPMSKDTSKITLNFIADAGQTYEIRLVPHWCNKSNLLCIDGQSSNWTSVTMRSRRGYFTVNNNCIYLNLSLSDSDCDQTNVSITCQGHFNNTAVFTSNTQNLCQLPDGAYRCIAIGTFTNKEVFRKSAHIVIGDVLKSDIRNMSCHCADGKQCDSNYFCRNGCETGWYGPGCQVSNIALHKPAKQSSQYPEEVADTCPLLAVDGDEANDSSVRNCSVANRNGSHNAWWYVQLSRQQDYIIHSVIIKDVLQLEKNISVLYTSSNNDDPPSATWEKCPVNTTARDIVYLCAQDAFGKKVGVTAQNGTDALTLCEVEVYGYQKRNCTKGYTGPGCLLHDCTAGNCTNGCGDFNGCKFKICPNPAFLPPDCWISLPSLQKWTLKLSSTCYKIKLDLNGIVSEGNLNFTNLLVEIELNKTIEVPDGLREMDISASPGSNYTIRLLPQYCNGSSSCFYGPGTDWKNVTTASRTHSYSTNRTCFFFNISNAAFCEDLSWQIECLYPFTQELLNNTNGRTVCGYKPGRTYTCTLKGLLENILVDTIVYNISVLADSQPDKYTSTFLTFTVGIVMAVITCCVIITITVIVMRRKHKTPRPSYSDKNKREVKTDDHLLELNPYYHEREELTYGNIGGMTIAEFEEYVQDSSVIEKRFDELPGTDLQLCSIGKMQVNKTKNRFQNILPYDRNRVVIINQSVSYINASYVDGAVLPRQYIATQGPTDATLDDFWNMVWQERSPMIVMLTNYVEKGKKKCEHYFPRAASRTRPIDIEVKSASYFDTHSVTILELNCADEKRVVQHLHFTAWPDHSVPKHCAELLIFYMKLDTATNCTRNQIGPVIVHCSAGVGRTGTFIAFSYLLQKFKIQGRVDVDYCVQKLRDQRMQMVQTKEQYIFLHRTLLYAMKTYKYIHDPAVLQGKVMNQMQHTESSTLPEWQDLNQCSDSSSESRYRYHGNKHCNAPATDVQTPTSEGDTGLQLDTNSGKESLEENDIHFTYCNGCYSAAAFLVASLPCKQKDVSTLWGTVFNEQPSSVVMLLDGKEFAQTFPSPGETVVYDALRVTNLGRGGYSANTGIFGRYALIIERATNVPGFPSLPVTTALFVNDASVWYSPENESTLDQVVSLANDLAIINKERRTQQMFMLCRDGRSHSGVFIGILNSLQRLLETQSLQVFHSSDLVRASSTKFIEREDHYEFIYKVLRRYYEDSTIYANP